MYLLVFTFGTSWNLLSEFKVAAVLKRSFVSVRNGEEIVRKGFVRAERY